MFGILGGISLRKAISVTVRKTDYLSLRKFQYFETASRYFEIKTHYFDKVSFPAPGMASIDRHTIRFIQFLSGYRGELEIRHL